MSATGKIELGPLASLLAVVATAAANVTGLTASIGLNAWICDVLGAAVFISSGCYWAKRSWAASRPKTAVGFIGAAPARPSTDIPISVQIASAALLVGVGAWYGTPAAQKIFRPQWKVCGTIASSCTSAICISGLDTRRRQIFAHCAPPKDISGFFVLESKSGMDYEPSYLKLECNDKTAVIIETPKKFTRAECDSLLELP